MKVKIDLRMQNFLKKKKIKMVVIFGSFVSNKNGNFSDIDIAILPSVSSNLELYNDMYKIFSDFFSSFHKEVDIIFLDIAPLDLKFEIVNSGQLFYEHREGYFLEYKEKVMKEYIDLSFHQKRFEKAIIETFK